MVTFYQTVNDFLEQNERAMLANEAASCLVLGNARAERDKPCVPERMFGNVLDDAGNILLIFCNYYPFNLCVYAHTPDRELQGKAAAELARTLTEQKPFLFNGLTANRAVCDFFFETYRAPDEAPVFLAASMDIMELTALTPVKLAPGSQREAEEADIPLLTWWNQEFEREALHSERSTEDAERSVRRAMKSGFYLYCGEDGQPVSGVVTARRMENTVTLNHVYTPPAFRGKGYAQSNVYLTCRRVLESGYQKCSLFVDQTNPISNRVYEKISFKITEDQYDYRFKRRKGN